MKDNQNEQLFSELTPAEAAVVEGGMGLIIDRIHAIKAGADNGNPDDTYITVDGKKIWGYYSMTTGQSRDVNKTTAPLGSSARVELFDDDRNAHDGLGGFSARNTNGVQKRARVSGGGSIYDIYYRAFA